MSVSRPEVIHDVEMRKDWYEHISESHRLEDSKNEQQRVVANGGHLGRAMSQTGEPGGPLRCWPGG